MTTKLTKFSSLLSLAVLSISLSAKAEFKGIWMAGGAGQKVVTNYDVSVYAKNYIISDKVKMSLFKSTNEDFELYQEKLDELAEKLYEETLNRMIYQRYIETFANFKQTSGKRVYFATTSREFDERIRSEINKYLTKHHNSREEFGKFLQEQGYPHKKGESAVDTYYGWEDLLRYRVKEDFRVKNVNNAEYGIAFNDYPNRYRMNADDIMAVPNYIDNHRKGWTKIAGKTMTQGQYESLSKNLDPMIVDAKVIGLNSSIKEIKASKGYVARAASYIAGAFKNKTFQAPIAKVSEYVELASELASSKSQEELNNSKQKELEKYMSGEARSSIVLARLYDLALELQERAPLKMASAGSSAISSLTNAAELESLIKAAGDNDHVIDVIGNSLKNNDSAEEALLIEVVKNSLEEIAKRSDVHVEANLKKELSMDEYDLARSKIRQANYAEVINYFRKNGVNRYAHFLKRSLNGRYQETGDEVLSKIIP